MIKKLSELHGWDKNPRGIKKADFERLKSQIKELGLYKPFVITKDGTVLGGNMRLKACTELGITDVECVVVNAPTEELRIKYALADNDRAGYYEEDQLAELILSIPDINLDDYKLDLGTPTSVEDLLKQFAPEPEEDEAPEVSQDETVSKLGEVYQLGRHRLMCGDSTDPTNLFLLYGKEKIDMVLTDPPYGMDLDTDYSKMPGTSTKYSKVIGDSEEFDMSKIFAIVDTPVWYIWGADYLYKSIPNFDKGNMIVWAKRQSDEENSVFGSAFELCWTYPKRKKEIWFVRSINQSSERLGEHPTQKPTELSIRALKQNPDAKNILDLFLGSGSTLIACEQTNRTCYGMELDPKYCDVIRKRYAKFIGKEDEWETITAPVADITAK